MIAHPNVPRCSAEEWKEFQGLVRHGMLFELIEWVEAGRPTLRPENKHWSALGTAAMAPNFSMTQVLWERAWQEKWEAECALGRLSYDRTSTVVMRYLLESGCPADHVTGYDLCLTHDLDLVRLGMSRGVDILEPDGWAAAFTQVGSRPLIRFYLEERDRIPGLRRDAVYALCRSIQESRLRAVALLKWAGVDPLEKAPRYGDWDEPKEGWDGFPALYLGRAKKVDELLDLLKLKPSVGQWFDLLKTVAWGAAESIPNALALMADPNGTIRENPVHSVELLRDLTLSLCWGWTWNPSRDERLVNFCLQLLELGVRLRWRDKDDIASFRRDVYRSDRQENVFRVLSRAAELADSEKCRTDLIELVRTPKMRELVISHDSMMLKHLGQRGPVDYMPVEAARQVGRRRKSREVVSAPTVDENEWDEPRRNAEREAPLERERIVPARGHTIKRSGGRVLTREEIYADVWSEPATHLAEKYGISGSMLARICTKLNIPRPPRGYWAKPPNSRKKRKPSLPKWKSEDSDYWAVNPVNVNAQQLVKRRLSGKHEQ